MHYLIHDAELTDLAELLAFALGPSRIIDSSYLGGQAARFDGALIRPNRDPLHGGPYLEESPQAQWVLEFDRPDWPMSSLESISGSLRARQVAFRFVDD